MSCLVKWHANCCTGTYITRYLQVQTRGTAYLKKLREKAGKTYLGIMPSPSTQNHHKTPSKRSTTVNKEVGHTRDSSGHVQCARHLMQQKSYYLQLPVVS